MKKLYILLALCAPLSLFSQKTMLESNLLKSATVTAENSTIKNPQNLCDGNEWTLTSISGNGAALVCEFPQEVRVTLINIVAGEKIDQAPANVKLYGRSDTGSDWTAIGRGLSFSFDRPYDNSYARTQSGKAYLQYKIEFTGISDIQLGELQFVGYNPSLNILSTSDRGSYSTPSGKADYDGYNGEISVSKSRRDLGITDDNTWQSWLQFDFDTPTAIEGYTLGGKTYANRDKWPAVWQFQASNDGSEWVTLDIRANVFRVDGDNFAMEYGLGKSGVNNDFGNLLDKTYQMIDKKFLCSYGGGQFLAAFWRDNGTRDMGYNYWWMAHAVDAYVDAFRRTGSRTYNQRANSIKTGMYTAYDAGRLDLWNSYYDDMEWMCIACCHAAKVFEGDSKWLDEARQLFDWIWQGWDESTGGILWNNVSQRGVVDSKNSCSNGPAMIAAALLYQATGNEEYLNKAKRIFEFMNSNNLFSDGFVKDAPKNENRGWTFTYNQGTWVGGLLELYRITGDTQYRDIAVDLMDKCTASSWYSPRGILIEGDGFGDGDGGMFKGIFARYLTEWVISGLLDDERQTRYANYLLENARSLVDAAMIKPDMTFMANWQNRGMANSGQYCSAVVLSALCLLEGVDRMRQEGILNDDYSIDSPFAGQAFSHYRIVASENFGANDVNFSSFALLGAPADDNGVDGINDDDSMLPDVWYTIQGTAVSAPTAPGIYIHKGRKVIVR